MFSILFVTIAGIVCAIMGTVYTRIAIRKRDTESTFILGIAFLLLAVVYFGVDIKMLLSLFSK